MKQEIFELIKQYQKQNSNIKLTEEELLQEVLSTENNLKKELTGYPTIDEPYQQFYSEYAMNRTYPKIKIIDYVVEAAHKYPNKVAYEYYNQKITYQELLDNILKTAYILAKNFNIQENDFVVFSMPSTPETIYLFFALNLIGAISRPIDPIASPNVIKANMLETNAKLLVTLDLNYKKYQKIIDELDDTKVLLLSLADSLPLGILPLGKKQENIENTFINMANLTNKVLFSREKGKTPNCLKWKDLQKTINNNDYSAIIDDFKYRKNSIVSVLSTSGSTGEPKGVCLTNENFVASIEKQVDADFDLKETWKIFNPMPTCSSYFWDDILLAIRYGMTTKLCPLFNAEKAPKLIINASCEINLAGPLIFEKWNEYLSTRPNINLAHQKVFISGGDILFKELEQKTNNTQKQHNSPAIIANAIGTSEQVGPSNSPNGILKNKNAYQEGSVGVILPGNSMGIFAYDEENDCRNINTPNYDMGLMYYQIGEICYKKENENIFLEYYKNKKATDEVFLTHQDGTIWYHTGDLGYLDIDGRTFCSGRKNGLIISDGHKVWAPKIENIVKQIKGVLDCAVIGVADLSKNEVPVLFINYDNNISDLEKDQLKNIINNTILTNLDEYHLPTAYIELTEIPRNLMLKAKTGELNNLYNQYLENNKTNQNIKVRKKKSQKA